MVKRIVFLAETYNTYALQEEIIRAYPDSIIVNYDYYKYIIIYVPDRVKIKRKESSVVRFNNYYLSLFGTLYHSIRLFALALSLCFRFKPQVVVVEGYLYSFLIGLLKYLKLCKKTVYISGDWFAGSKRKSRLIGYVLNEYFFPIIDYFSCKINDVVLNTAEPILGKRYNYWNGNISKKERNISYPLPIKARNEELHRATRKICFLGLMRDECGLDIAIKSIKSLREYGDFSLEIVGPYSYEYKALKKLADDIGVSNYVNFLGFIKRDEFGTILNDCFCGINLLKTEGAYSALTVLGKIVYYMGYLLPIVATKTLGYTKEIIIKNNLGIIINPNENEFISAILKIYKEQAYFRRNMISYLKNYKSTPVSEIVEISEEIRLTNAIEKYLKVYPDKKIQGQ